MPLRGPTSQTTLLTSVLNPSLLLRLSSDLLFSYNHRGIKLTDGPGDGGRDIQSITAQNERHITQCKYHENHTTTCSSHDVGELVLALVKFGIKNGLFITNGRISPQGKREYLDAYPGLQLQFLDGEELVAEIISNPILKALWFDGKDIAVISSAFAIPFLVRIHAEDTPLDREQFFQLDRSLISSYLERFMPELIYTVQSEYMPTRAFAPYRAPEPLTMFEGATNDIRAFELIAVRDMQLSDISELAAITARAITSAVKEAHNNFTVRAGAPQICTLSGEHRGTRIPLQISPVAYIHTDHSCGVEIEWYSARNQSVWSDVSDARVTQAGAIRLYSEALDCCLSYEIRSRVSDSQRCQYRLQNEHTLRGWELSTFALMPYFDKWPYEAPEPDEKGLWPWDGRILCGWLHWTLLGAVVPCRLGSHESEMFNFPDETETQKCANDIKSFIESVENATLLAADKARYMVALIGTDPLRDQEFEVIETCDVVHYPDMIPSPIQPMSRIFRATVIVKPTAQQDVPMFIKLIEKLDLPQWVTSINSFVEGEFVRIAIAFAPPSLNVHPTPLVLEWVHRVLESLLKTIADQSGHIQYSIETKRYWRDVLNVNLGTNWKESDKKYVVFSGPSQVDATSAQSVIDELFN